MTEEAAEDDGKLPDYYLREFDEVFDILVDEEMNAISSRKLFDLMRILGTPANPEDCLTLLNNYDPDNTGFLDYNSCLDIMTTKWKQITPYEELREAFQKWDSKNTGNIKERDLRIGMSTLGDPLNKADLKKFLSAAVPNDKGLYVWDDYVTLLKDCYD